MGTIRRTSAANATPNKTVVNFAVSRRDTEFLWRAPRVRAVIENCTPVTYGNAARGESYFAAHSLYSLCLL